jgi:hypothetical protein
MRCRLVVCLILASLTEASACAVPRGPQATVANITGPCDDACYKKDRDDFVKDLEARLQKNKGKQEPNERRFNRWSGTAILTGLVGGVLGLTLPHDNDRKNVASVTSLTTGAIAAWLATRKFETRATRYESCVVAANAAINTITTSYSDAFLPANDDEGKAYLDVKRQINQQLNEVCPE